MSDQSREGGEEALIATYFAPLARSFPGALGLLDDCANLSAKPGHEFVVTMDAVAAGVHFFPDDPPFDIGWKALAVNVSDLVAKGARPSCYFMSIAFPERPAETWLQAFTDGLRAAQERFGLSLAGGDTDRRPGAIAITITAIGDVPSGRMVRRGAARPGDRLFVSGTLGCAALGLRLRGDEGLATSLGLTSDQADQLVGRYLRPEPPLALAGVLLDLAAAAMDLSDGLAKDLRRMMRSAGVGAEVDTSLVPLSSAFRAAVSVRPELIMDALAGGDDYQVLVAVHPGDAAQFKDASRGVGVTVTEIGRVTQDVGVKFHDAEGRPIEIARGGWDHFA